MAAANTAVGERGEGGGKDGIGVWGRGGEGKGWGARKR